ncbi:hypothetical protein QM797_01070 [Rhodococcus sp. IEGM 1381]|uniref:hypothetical protein n=1 Tax=Rhodococcus sp. IEGM 1381 TaxID=3047085 RepID=UPI0024B64315|nr:hypothetical protein [Rhodococcus sp. IEGM 1381]MDI9893304.1 hypothetical protein [Rhodococcus sp. IEGM 1381]
MTLDLDEPQPDAFLLAGRYTLLDHSAVAAVIPGATRPSRTAEDIAAWTEKVPTVFWEALREQKIDSADAPLPDS